MSRSSRSVSDHICAYQVSKTRHTRSHTSFLKTNKKESKLNGVDVQSLCLPSSSAAKPRQTPSACFVEPQQIKS